MEITIGRLKLPLKYSNGGFSQKQLRKLPKVGGKKFGPPHQRLFDRNLIFQGFCGEKPSIPAETSPLITVPAHLFVKSRKRPGIWTKMGGGVKPIPPDLMAKIKADEKACRETMIKASGLSEKRYDAAVRSLSTPLAIPFPTAVTNALLGKFEFKIYIYIRYINFVANPDALNGQCLVFFKIPHCYYFDVKIDEPCGEFRKPKFKPELTFFPLTKSLKILELEANKAARKIDKLVESSEGK